MVLNTMLMLAADALAGDALSEYATRRLVCWAETRYHEVTQIYDDGTISTEGGDYRIWGVRDGRGRALDTRTFAAMIGDDEYVEELEQEAQKIRKSGRTIALAGGGLFLLGGASYLVGRQSESFGVTYGGIMASAGGVSLGGYGLAIGASSQSKLTDVSHAYEYGLAAQRCASYNQAIREELGLSPEETHLLDTASVAWPEERVQRVVVRPVIAAGGLALAGTV